MSRHRVPTLGSLLCVSVVLLLVLSTEARSLGDVVYGTCEEAIKKQRDAAAREGFQTYQTVLDLDTAIVGISKAVLSHTKFHFQFDHKEGKALIMFSSASGGQADIEVTLSDVKVEIVEALPYYLDWIIPKVMEFEKISLKAKLFVKGKGEYNRKDSKAGEKVLFDVHDLSNPTESESVPDTLGADVEVDLSDVTYKLIGGKGLVRQNVIAFLDWAMGGLVAPKIKTLIGNQTKCFLRQKQPNFLGLIHESWMTRSQELKDCGKKPTKFCHDWLANNGHDLRELSDQDETAVAEEAAEVRKKLLKYSPQFRIAVTASHKYTDGTDLFTADTEGEYKVEFTMDTPTGPLLSLVRNAGASIFEILAEAKHNVDDNPSTIYMKNLMSKWLMVRMIDPSKVNSILTFFQDSSLSPDTTVQIILHGFQFLISSAKKDRVDGEPYGFIKADRLKLKLDNHENTEMTAFPMDLILARQSKAQNKEHILHLCRTEFPDELYKFDQCVAHGLSENMEHLDISAEETKALLASERYKLTGNFGSKIDDLAFAGGVGKQFWKTLGESQCALENDLCRDILLLFGEYLTVQSSEINIQTPDAEIFGASRDWSEERHRGIEITKDDFIANLNADFKGSLNLGVILALVSNLNRYITAAAEAIKNAEVTDQVALDHEMIHNALDATNEHDVGEDMSALGRVNDFISEFDPSAPTPRGIPGPGDDRK